MSKVILAVFLSTVIAFPVAFSASGQIPSPESGEPCAPGSTTTLADDDMSARVFGSYTARKSASSDFQLCLLVLWRGEPGWHIHREKSRTAYAEKYVEVLREHDLLQDLEWLLDFPRQTYHDDLGDLTIAYDYDWNAHRVHILDTDLDLGASNVVLIDWVDSVGGEPQVVQTIRIDPQLSGQSNNIQQLADRSPIIRSFVQ